MKTQSSLHILLYDLTEIITAMFRLWIANTKYRWLQQQQHEMVVEA